MSNPYYNIDIRAAEEFMVFLHKQQYQLVDHKGKPISLLKAMDDYQLDVNVQQKEIDDHVSRCETESICLSCGEPGFPYCDRHDGTDPYEGALPEIDEGDDEITGNDLDRGLLPGSPPQ
jgi:hypothetical protein